MQGVPAAKMGGTHESTGPGLIPSLPPIPDGPPEVVALQLLKAAAADKLIPQLDAEIARLDRMAASSHVRIRESTPGALYSALKNQVGTLVKLERLKRRYLGRQAALGGAADKVTASVTETAAASLRDVPGVPAAAERVRQLEGGRLAKDEERIRSMLHASTQVRTSIGPFHQDVFIDDLTAAVGDRAKIVRMIKSKGDDLTAIVEFFSPAEQGSP
jgi:hypothetical protein